MTDSHVEAAADEIAWFNNVDAALEAARQRNVMVMVDVYTDWCGWCDELDDKVYTNKAVISFAGEFVNLKVNAEDRGQGQKFADRFGVDSYPTILFLDANGIELDRIGGYLPPESFLQEMNRIHRLPELFAAAEANEIGDEDRVLLARYYISRRNFDKSISLLEPLLESLAEYEKEFQGSVLITRGEAELYRNRFAQAETYLLRIYEGFPEFEESAKNLFYLVFTRSFSGDKDGARKYFKELERRFPKEERMIGIARQALN